MKQERFGIQMRNKVPAGRRVSQRRHSDLVKIVLPGKSSLSLPPSSSSSSSESKAGSADADGEEEKDSTGIVHLHPTRSQTTHGHQAIDHRSPKSHSRP
jgi:hypothetical protein